MVSGLSAAGKPKKITLKGADVPFSTVTGLDHGSFEFHFSRTIPCNSVRSKFRTTSIRGINRRAIFSGAAGRSFCHHCTRHCAAPSGLGDKGDKGDKRSYTLLQIKLNYAALSEYKKHVS